MKKIFSICLIILCFAFMCVLSACADKNESNTNKSDNIVVDSENKTTVAVQGENNETTEVNLAEVLANINEEFSISSDSMMVIDNTDDLELFYGVLPDDIKQYAAQTTKNSSTEVDEIILIEAVDSEAAERVYEALEYRYSTQRDLCASYSAELLAIIDKSSVESDGNYVALIMSADAENISEFYNSFIG